MIYFILLFVVSMSDVVRNMANAILLENIVRGQIQKRAMMVGKEKKWIGFVDESCRILFIQFEIGKLVDWYHVYNYFYSKLKFKQKQYRVNHLNLFFLIRLIETGFLGFDSFKKLSRLEVFLIWQMELIMIDFLEEHLLTFILESSLKNL